MKLSTQEVRRLRTARGWSQEHLAQAAGLSERTVQRVEAEGTASMATATCLAATFEVSLLALQLQDDPAPAPAAGHSLHPAWLHAGLAVLTLAALRLAFDSAAGQGGGLFTAVDITAALAGLALCALPLRQAIRGRQFTGLALAVFGAPLATSLAVSLAFAVASQRLPTAASVLIGLCGLVLVALSCRHLATPTGQPTNGGRPSLGELG